MRLSRAVSIFCWVIEYPGDGARVQMLVEQMDGCDDHLVFSNHSSHENMVALKMPGGWNGTKVVAAAYEFLAHSTVVDTSDWLVRVDSATFFRPRALRGILAAYPGDAQGVSPFLFLDAALEVASRGVVRGFGDGALFSGSLGDSPHDDAWRGYAVQHGGQVGDWPDSDCLSLVLNGDFLRTAQMFPKLIKQYDAWNTTWLPELLQEDFGTSPPCVRDDVVAIHPVSNVSHYREFQRLTES